MKDIFIFLQMQTGYQQIDLKIIHRQKLHKNYKYNDNNSEYDYKFIIYILVKIIEDTYLMITD